MIPSSAPVLGLRMQSDRSEPPAEFTEGCDHVERVRVMIAQDETYSCNDYLAKASAVPAAGKESSACDYAMEEDDDLAAVADSNATMDAIDAVCRERMATWKLRVVDHFHVPRETVAVSFSYLDRFVDLCHCDRSAFKLAAMTTLYMAAKVFGSSHNITIRSLAELSRGEFEMSHISEMETIILQTLEWRLSPPTAQCFINSFYNYLPVPQGPVSMAVYQRSIFFVELAMYDHSFVTKKRSLLALAAMINAMEGLNESTFFQQQQDSFVDNVCRTFGLKFSQEEIEGVRNRLWYVYSMSAQYKEDDGVSPDVLKSDSHRRRKLGDEDAMQVEPSSPSSSPVSVATCPASSSQHRS